MILDYLFTTGQVAAAMLMIYGAMLTIGMVMPPKQSPDTLGEKPLHLDGQPHVG